MWLCDKYPVEIKTQLHLFLRIKEGREGITSLSVMTVCLYLHLMLIYGLMYIRYTSNRIWCVCCEHKGIRAGAAEEAKKAGKAGIIGFFFNFYILRGWKGQHPNVLGGKRSKKSLQPLPCDIVMELGLRVTRHLLPCSPLGVQQFTNKYIYNKSLNTNTWCWIQPEPPG